MEPVTIATLASLAGKGLASIGQIFTGNSEEKEAERITKANKRPAYSINKPIIDNSRYAASRASAGLSDAAKQVYSSEAERGLTSGADAILRGGGSVNNIADLYGNFENGVSRMSLIDDEMRTRNMKDVYSSNDMLSGEMDKEFQINQWGPYADAAQAAAALRKQGSDNKWKGINGIVSTASDAAVAMQYEKEGESVYGQHTPPPPVNSRVVTSQPTQAQIIQGRYPGLMNSGWRITPYLNVPDPQ